MNLKWKYAKSEVAKQYYDLMTDEHRDIIDTEYTDINKINNYQTINFTIHNQDNEIVAFISIFVNENTTSIKRIYVKEEFRLKGYARNIIEKIIDTRELHEDTFKAKVYSYDGYMLFKNLGFNVYDIGDNGEFYFKKYV